MKREDLTEKLLDIKREKGWSWKHICEKIGGYSEVLITGAILGQMKLTKPQAANAGELFGLSKAEVAMLNETPMRGMPMPPTDPLIYRFYELVMVNGPAWKALIEEEFGDGIMSAIDFDMAIERQPDPKGDRVKIARSQSAALFVSIHADALPRREGDAQGATIYTVSDKASDAEAERLAEAENKADAIAGVNLTDEPTEVADILIDLAQRETKTFSNRFARLLMDEMKTTVRMHKHPLKSAGFRVLKAPDVPSVLVEIGYVSNKGDLEHLVSENWRNKAVGSMVQAIDTFFSKRLATAGPAK